MKRMKQVILITLAMVMMASLVFGASIPLKATWTHTDAVTIGYRVYRTDGVRALMIDVPGTPTFPVLFTITVPDGTTGTATFVVIAYSATKVSGDSNVASYPFDLTPVPAVPTGLGVSP
jgi:hypothetical protein